MKEKVINRLVTVKSIVTIILAIVFAYLSVTEAIPADKFQDIFYIVIAFYFGSQLEKTARDTGTTTD